jgi:hypothetical protein
MTQPMDLHKTEGIAILRFHISQNKSLNRYSSVVEWWATGWMIEGSSPRRRWEVFSAPLRPDRLWGQHSLLSNGYQGSFPGGKASGA